LQSYHLMAIGMPEPVQQTSTVLLHTPGSPASVHQQQRDGPIACAAATVFAADAAAIQKVQEAEGQQSEGAGAAQLEQQALRATAVADAGAAGNALVLAAEPAACSIGGAAGHPVSQPVSSSVQWDMARMVLHQLPLPHLLHLELDGCR
jgi:hypothetical protein